MASDFGTFIIQLLWIWLIIMFIFIWFMVIMDLFSDHTMGGFAKAIWIIVLIIFPPIATLIYLIARGKRRPTSSRPWAVCRPPIRSPRPSRCSTLAPSPSRSSTR
jgi:hypothetical protein